MKAFIIPIVCLISSVSFGSNYAPACYSKAENAVTKFVESGVYDNDGIHADKCSQSPRGRALVCEVSAAKGNGAATDSYLAVLSLDCKRVFRVELIGEE